MQTVTPVTVDRLASAESLLREAGHSDEADAVATVLAWLPYKRE